MRLVGLFRDSLAHIFDAGRAALRCALALAHAGESVLLEHGPITNLLVKESRQKLASDC
jgi:hypothetical protein